MSIIFIAESIKTINDSIQKLEDNITIIKTDIGKMKVTMVEIKKMRVRNNPDFICSVQQLNKKYNYDIPFKAIEEFKTFNNQLFEKKDIRESVVIHG